MTTDWVGMQAQLVRQIPSRDWVMLDRQTLEARFMVGEWTLDLAAHPVGSPDANEYAWHVTATAGDEERHEDGYKTLGEVLAKYSFELALGEEE